MTENKNYDKYLEWALILVTFIGLVVFATKPEFTDTLKPETKTGMYIMFIGIIVMVHIVLFVHELGHLLMGLVQGFRFDLFVVGLLGINRADGKIHVHLNKNLGYYGGVAATVPVDTSPANAVKFARVLLAGPIASVLFAVICIALAYVLPKPYGLSVYIGGVMSVGIFLVTTIPSKTGLFFTDRKRYQRLMSPGKDQQVELAILALMGAFVRDNSYQNIARKDIETIITDDSPLIKYYGIFNLICWQLQHTGTIDGSLQATYDQMSPTLSKSMVAVFDKEISNYKDLYQQA